LNKNLSFKNIIIWIFAVLFFVIGILNLFLIHPVPGIFYLILSLIYFPPGNSFFREKFKISISFRIKVIIALIILWGTLAVGDLAELLGL